MATPTAVVDLFDTIFFMRIKSFSLSLTPIKRLTVRPFVDAAFSFTVYQTHAKKSAPLVVAFKCVYLKSFKRIDFGMHS